MLGLFRSLVAVAALAALAAGHGSHSNDPVDPHEDWATRHMREEHHITGFDPTSFFTLHDYDESGYWTDDELRRTYGFDHESTDWVPEERRKQAMDQVFAIFDRRKQGIIEQADFVRLSNEGHKLPDFGFGPGHHGDMEYEYEIHHYEKYHDDDASEDELTHPEDIEHFKKHREAEELQKKIEELEQMAIVEENIPAKFYRHR